MFPAGRRAIAEGIGTAILCLVGPGAVVAARTATGQRQLGLSEGDFLAIAFAFGLTVSTLVYAIGKVSGCHINPAVTLALAATRRFPWREVPIYWAAQLAGAVIGVCALWAVFGQNAVTFGMGQTHIAAQFSAADYARAALAEAIGTGLLLLAILGITDSRSPQQLAGIVIGGALTSLILIFGPLTGASLNPARAFGPELVAAVGGGTTYWGQLVPIYVLPGLAGAVVAAFGYDLLAHPRHVSRPIQEAVSHEEPEV